MPDLVAKQWVSVVDKRTTIICLFTAGQIRAADEPFQTPVGQLDKPPAHIHCRATVAVWVRGFVNEHRKQANQEIIRRGLKRGPSAPEYRHPPMPQPPAIPDPPPRAIFPEADWEQLRADFGFSGLTPAGQTPPELAAGRFKGSAYKPVNRYLRGTGRVSLPEPEVRQLITDLDQAFTRTTRSDMVAFRGIDEGLAETLERGSVFTDAGYPSMTAKRALADSWAGEEGWVVESRIPAGTPAYVFGDDSFEYEILLQRKLSWRVLSRVGRRLVVELVAPAEA